MIECHVKGSTSFNRIFKVRVGGTSKSELVLEVEGG